MSANDPKQAERCKRWRAANKERVKTYNAAYHEANKDRISKWRKVYLVEYNSSNSEKNKARARKWYLRNRAHAITKSAAWRKANRERVNELSLAAYYRNPATHYKRTLAWARANKPKIVAARTRRLERLTDGVIRQKLTNRTNLISSDIPQSLVECYRIYLKTKQLLKTT